AGGARRARPDGGGAEDVQRRRPDVGAAAAPGVIRRAALVVLQVAHETHPAAGSGIGPGAGPGQLPPRPPPAPEPPSRPHRPATAARLASTRSGKAPRRQPATRSRNFRSDTSGPSNFSIADGLLLASHCDSVITTPRVQAGDRGVVGRTGRGVTRPQGAGRGT